MAKVRVYKDGKSRLVSERRVEPMRKLGWEPKEDNEVSSTQSEPYAADNFRLNESQAAIEGDLYLDDDPEENNSWHE